MKEKRPVQQTFLKKSIMSVGFLLTVSTGCYVAIAAVHLNRDLTATGILVGALLTTAFGGKWLQKKVEKTNSEK
jgi:hypothetical protein